MDTPLYFAAQSGFTLLTVVYLSLFLWEIRKGVFLTSWADTRKRTLMRRLIAAVVLWAAFVITWSLSGRMADFSIFPFNFMPVIVIPLIALILLSFSKDMGTVLQHIPPDNLVRLQSFRVFVEILLWVLFFGNLLPVQMTFEGRNFDILAGLTAPAIAFLMMRSKISKTAVVVWNILSLTLLLNIVITAILSTPSQWRIFMNEPANYIVAYFPISLLPGFLVPLAYYLHVFSLKQISRSKTLSSPSAAHKIPAQH
ncbi:MAG: hypothetical protein WA874_16075 [Chryseosolibacter sp.]